MRGQVSQHSVLTFSGNSSLETGILKVYLSATDRAVSKKMHAYFGKRIPSLQIRAPHMPSLLNTGSSEELGSLSPSNGPLTLESILEHWG